ncbi:putative protein kinase RLK-Pelle-DLSV family [Rosa chinensis]|uniref:non-specific serine/threonine protein kinase n=1 Tax=Rosa chinensis TaxID=74649 RepID=A0A2P6PEE4_ROSCH|nr:putative protein kinase RLK-Pelle-DLSV family [Rosa chinensis]
MQNYLSGSIPPEWGSTKLEFLVLSVNNLSGPIPAYLGNITTLRALALESNLFSGTIPPEMGRLINMEVLYLRANNLTGQLPVALTNMTKLKTLWIGSNNFTGKIPNYFLSWKELQTLEMQASGFEGPIPSTLSVLSNMKYLVISDLSGESSVFPNLSNMKNMQTLMLRSCNITGSIPEYISNMTSLQVLDLSFNRLKGSIPNLDKLLGLVTIYLTSNWLTGLPEWIQNRDSRYIVDLSYNNFSRDSVPTTCRETFNVFKSFSRQNNSILSNCLYPCSKEQYSLHINCGGKPITIGRIKYEGDEASGGGAKFFQDTVVGDLVALVIMGLQIDHAYIANNISIVKMNNSELYRTARLSYLSLTYYARCLANGNYTVKLHFAEIVLRDNRSYYGVGSRFFDVYIQEKLVLKDFNIEKAAQGVDKEVIKVFKAVVNVSTLEIRFYWAGKGTMNVPKRGTYGSLISAISIESDFNPPGDSNRKIFIVVGVAIVLCLSFMVFGILWFRSCFGGKISREQELKGLDLQTGLFRFKQIKAATNNFDAANKLGEGGFGTVYKFCPQEGKLKLDWPKRQKICIGIARGLAFLHEESTLKIVHRDIKMTNILLDRDLNPKISDFGLAKLNEEEKTHISTRVAGTIGYMAPEYAQWGYLTDKVDVYSFGVVALELVSGKNNIKYRPNENCVCLLDWALVLQQKENMMELVDPNLGSEFNKEEAMRMIKVALLCTNPSPALRPTMSAALSMLEGRAVIHESSMSSSMYGDELGFKAFRDEHQEVNIQQSPGETRSLIYSSNAKGQDASSSRTVQDSYTFNLDSP